jgi:hypothetical protein
MLYTETGLKFLNRSDIYATTKKTQLFHNIFLYVLTPEIRNRLPVNRKNRKA